MAAKKRKKRRKINCRRVKSGPRKGRCRLKKKGARRGVRRTKRHAKRSVSRKPFCVKVRGKKRAIHCYRSAKPALKKAHRLRASGADASVKGPGKMV